MSKEKALKLLKEWQNEVTTHPLLSHINRIIAELEKQPEPTEIQKKFDEYQDIVHSLLRYLQKAKIVKGTGTTCEEIKEEILTLIYQQGEKIKQLQREIKGLEAYIQNTEGKIVFDVENE